MKTISPVTGHGLKSIVRPGAFDFLLWGPSILQSPFSIFVLFLLLSVGSAFAATRYVWQDSPSPGPPFTDWTTAAHVIQDAVDAADSGDTVLVAGGVYATGGRAVGTNLLVNRVAIDRAITVESLMGPEVTIIEGAKAPGGGNGDGAIRCVYLADDASLSGFTLTNGATRTNGNWYFEGSGGGVLCEFTNTFVLNCILTGNSASVYGGGAECGTLNNCTLTGNSADAGGGADYCTLTNCTLTGNSAELGGGAYDSTLTNCTLTDNSAYYGGGGAYAAELNNCTLTGNSAFGVFDGGGGAYNCTLNNCTLTGNSALGAYGDGGGANDCWLYNCTLTGNSALGAFGAGGGAAGGWLYNCTLTGNSADSSGGGVSFIESWDFGDLSATLVNCVVYFNVAPFGANYTDDTELDYCCTTPLPSGGVGNISLDPQLASASHLSANSPCRGAGSAHYASGTDIDGEAWANPPSIGCDEYHVSAVTGPLSVNIVAAYTNVAVGFPVDFTALIEGRTSASAWYFGDDVVVSNRPYASHAWASPGDYVVFLLAFNETWPDGVDASVTVHVVPPPVYYVSASGTNPVPPYMSWATAATTIQDAVEAVEVGTVPGAWVLVTNGVYRTGGRAVYGTMTNRVVVDKPLTLRSVNGPEFTIIQGYQVPGTINGDGAVRCVYLADGASLSGFTLTNGATRIVYDWPSYPESGGGGVWCEDSGTLTNCIVTGNSAYSGGGVIGGTLKNCTLTGNSAPGAYGGGGGAYDSTLNNCTLTGNSADSGGGANNCDLFNCTLTGNSAEYAGGACYGELNHCTLVGNSASQEGGGAWGGTLNNCIVYFNSAPSGRNFVQNQWTLLNYSCTTPMPTNGVGNIPNAPLFVDYAGGNLRLQSNSPCINAGNNAYVTSPTDLDGNPRIIGGTVDIGAYEYQGPGSVISYAWLQHYGLPTDGSADTLDTDQDGHNTWQEWKCWTDPTNPLSVLKLLPPQPQTNGTLILWQSVLGQSYSVERATNAGGPFSLLQGNIPGDSGTTSVTDTNPANSHVILYRVAVPE